MIVIYGVDNHTINSNFSFVLYLSQLLLAINLQCKNCTIFCTIYMHICYLIITTGLDNS